MYQLMIDKLNYTNTGSNCCGARVIDPWGTGEWICGDCKEHCTAWIIQEVDVAILNYMDVEHRIHIHRIEYDNTSTEYLSIDECVSDFIIEEYGSLNNIEFMYDEVQPMKMIDHREEVDN